MAEMIYRSKRGVKVTLTEKIKQIKKTKDNISKEYGYIENLTKEIVQEMRDNELKEIKIDDDLKAVLIWAVEKKIDYEKLMEKHADVYELGLKTTFSATQALNSVSVKLLNQVIKDCSIVEIGYKIKLQEVKEYAKRVKRKR